MKQAVLLLAHGAPEQAVDIGPYLTCVRCGKPLPPHVVEEIRRRYTLIGGGSPLLARTQEQAEALEALLAEEGFPVKVYVGMRNWHPFIRETMADIHEDGVDRIIAICLAPQYSRLSVGLYMRRTQEARQELGMETEIVWTKSLYERPLLVDAFAEKLRPLLPASKVLFTAHSLPEKMIETSDPYESEARATAEAVATRCNLANWDFAYQSQGMTGDRWLGPTVESRIDEYARNGVADVVVAPIGFVCDHIEIQYDVDVLFSNYAEQRGIRLRRTESLNASPRFIAVLAAVAREKLQVA